MSATNSSVQASSPATVQDILYAYSQSEQADKEVLLTILKAKTAEDQRIAALASLNEQCVAYAMQIQQEQNAATSSKARGSTAAAAVAQGSRPSAARGAAMRNRNRSLTRMPCRNTNSTPPSPPYTPSAIVSSSSTARAPEPHPYSNNLRRQANSSARTYYHQSGEYQQYPPLTISLPPIQATALPFRSQRGSVSPPSQRRLPQSDAAVLAYPAPQDRMNIQNFLSGSRD